MTYINQDERIAIEQELIKKADDLLSQINLIKIDIVSVKSKLGIK
jgi:hypothetical protein